MIEVRERVPTKIGGGGGAQERGEWTKVPLYHFIVICVVKNGRICRRTR